jgi:hypothetical protein
MENSGLIMRKYILLLAIVLIIVAIFARSAIFVGPARNSTVTNSQNTIVAAPNSNIAPIQTGNICRYPEIPLHKEPKPILLRFSEEPFTTLLNVLFACLGIILAIMTLLKEKQLDAILEEQVITNLEWPTVKDAIGAFNILAMVGFFIAISLIVFPDFTGTINIGFANLLAIPVILVMGSFLLLVSRIIKLISDL